MIIPRPPRIILFDWHATLVDTSDAMYQAMDDMLSGMGQLGLDHRLIDPAKSKTDDDRKLVEYVRAHHHLHPRIISDRKASRTDLLEVLFGSDEQAKDIANQAYNGYYRKYYGDVVPFEPGIRNVLSELRKLGIKLGILTNRAREFLDQELETIEQGTWFLLFDSVISGDDTAHLKPSADPVYRALEDFRATPGTDVWYVGDSTSDTVSAKRAGITSIFFNGAQGDARWIKTIFPGTDTHPHQPDYIVNNCQELLQLVKLTIAHDAKAHVHRFVPWTRRLQPLPKPEVILFDWHATLADTLTAMYRAVDDMLPRLEQLGLADRLVDPAQSKNEDDARLVHYVQKNYMLHPKIKAARKISRTDIFEVLFGNDEEAKHIAHNAFSQCYRNHCGYAEPLEPGVRDMLEHVKRSGVITGVLSNRDREFLERELDRIEGTGWRHLFDTIVAGDDTEHRKPAPDPILAALKHLKQPANEHAWYVGDSTTDITSAKAARIVGVFYNGAQWSEAWINRIFPGTPAYPHKPDAIVDNFDEFINLLRISLKTT